MEIQTYLIYLATQNRSNK